MILASGRELPEIKAAPGGWTGSELAEAPESWRLGVPDDVADELLQVAIDRGHDSLVTDPLQPPPSVSRNTRSFIAELHRRLAGEPGFVVVTGFPISEQQELTEAVYGAFGLLLGPPNRENALDERFIARVEGIGRDESRPGAQGYRLPTELSLHIDIGTDLIGLLCVRPAQRGGASSVVSSKKLHNIMLEEHPDLLSVLYQPVPLVIPPVRVPDGHDVPRWCAIPMFSQVDDQFAAHYGRVWVERSQALDDAPRLTKRQVAALDAVEELLDRPALSLEMSLRSGDLQLVNKLYVMHGRTAYYDDDPAKGRLLLRMHLPFPHSSALPEAYAPLFGATAGGTYRGGKWRIGKFRERLGTPLEAVGEA